MIVAILNSQHYVIQQILKANIMEPQHCISVSVAVDAHNPHFSFPLNFPIRAGNNYIACTIRRPQYLHQSLALVNDSDLLFYGYILSCLLCDFLHGCCMTIPDHFLWLLPLLLSNLQNTHTI